MRHFSNRLIPKVVIAGAGPGDKELITLKLYKALQAAEVVVTDRLVNADIISSYVDKSAEIIYAGKEGNARRASTAQTSINHILVEKAYAGKKVLRLKGGDVSFFSNLLEELHALSAHDIPFEIIPGVTAASGAAAYAGIPLTARGLSQGARFITFYDIDMYSKEEWKNISSTNDTLVFYMSARNVDALCTSLLEGGKDKETPVAIIEQATTPFQKTYFSTLQNRRADFQDFSFQSPSLVIVGEVVKLGKDFAWFRAHRQEGTIFKHITL